MLLARLCFKFTFYCALIFPIANKRAKRFQAFLTLSSRQWHKKRIINWSWFLFYDKSESFTKERKKNRAKHFLKGLKIGLKGCDVIYSQPFASSRLEWIRWNLFEYILLQLQSFMQQSCETPDRMEL